MTTDRPDTGHASAMDDVRVALFSAEDESVAARLVL
jgi:hypothetical protein